MYSKSRNPTLWAFIMVSVHPWRIIPARWSGGQGIWNSIKAHNSEIPKKREGHFTRVSEFRT